ncbi:MAG: hypothetical protein KJ063_02720 [Anaerolineae bacterium]|nr:hypothetical protein [Anaerolineae bacterium]
MAQRLTERYAPGDIVEIQFGQDERWWRGRVVRHDPPGVWVQTENGQQWFVTNTRRIRPVR